MMRTLIAGCAAVLVLTGCGSSDPGSSGSSDEPVVVDIAVKDGKVTPQGDRVDVKVGQKVTLHITSDTDEEIHVHSEPEHEYEVSAGADVKKSFTLKTPGQVAVEAHHLDATIVQLVVKP
jgi:plastocyanin